MEQHRESVLCVAAGIVAYRPQLPAQKASGGVEFLNQHLHGVQLALSSYRLVAGEGADPADLDHLAFVLRPGGRHQKGE